MRMSVTMSSWSMEFSKVKDLPDHTVCIVYMESGAYRICRKCRRNSLLSTYENWQVLKNKNWEDIIPEDGVMLYYYPISGKLPHEKHDRENRFSEICTM